MAIRESESIPDTPAAMLLRNNDDYFNLGTYKRRITTSCSQAQLWFDRGLIWCYGFNHEEGKIYVPCLSTNNATPWLT